MPPLNVNVVQLMTVLRNKHSNIQKTLFTNPLVTQISQLLDKFYVKDISDSSSFCPYKRYHIFNLIHKKKH